jgi:chlorobactene glucosyltransferase
MEQAFTPGRNAARLAAAGRKARNANASRGAGWLALSTLGLLAGSALTWWLHRSSALRPAVDPNARPAAPGDLPLISVMVPARNEARNIGRCLEALLAQTYPRLELLVVDDRSTDATGRIVAELAQRDSRLHAICGRPLPPGWAGKPHALVQAAGRARGEWLCFVDADTFARPELLEASLAEAQAQQADMFSILTAQQLGTFWEKAVMPLVFTALAAGYAPEHVNNPRRPEAIANGQFILIRREVYDAVGGHAALHDSITEDKQLAENVKRAGYRLVLADGRQVAETRMYTSLAELWEGWSKNIYLGLQGQPGLLLLGVAATLSGALLLPAWPLAAALWLARGGGTRAAVVLAQAGAAWGHILYARAGVLRQFGLPAWYGLTLPLGSLIFGAMMVNSSLRILSGRGVTWKGRRYRRL